jgi:hypothetical protein
MSDVAARLLEPGKIITSSNFDSACCCGEAAIADFVFPRISPSGKSVEAEATQVIARPSLQELSETANPRGGTNSAIEALAQALRSASLLPLHAQAH